MQPFSSQVIEYCHKKRVSPDTLNLITQTYHCKHLQRLPFLVIDILSQKCALLLIFII